jgi:hypothetical protein
VLAANPVAPFSFTNLGLQMQLPVVRIVIPLSVGKVREEEAWVGLLYCAPGINTGSTMLGILLNMEKHQVGDGSSKRTKRSLCVLIDKVCSTVLVAMRDVTRCSFENVTIVRGFYEAKERSWRYYDSYIINVCPALRDMGYKLVKETAWYRASFAYPLGRPHYQRGVRVRWVDHKCKVNSDEFDEEATLCSW